MNLNLYRILAFINIFYISIWFTKQTIEKKFSLQFHFFRQITNHSAIYYCKKALQLPMGKKALLKSFATSHGKKTFAQIEKFRQIDGIFAQILQIR